ncbi:MAG: hypothetical protein Q8922_04310 [Bacteroidota bacterium]|nr:hypothetical protein [Bacteroidota bacterium]MDP4231803.1 hypothetical protein [Bacteroidota bacterium]MDP4242689.1 hypothetical protein [Bacteroidota bacterium]MDP4287140.1 hypothetical protein [Bacteroidota bacterium]
MATKITHEEWVTSSGDPSDLGFSIARSPQQSGEQAIEAIREMLWFMYGGYKYR